MIPLFPKCRALFVLGAAVGFLSAAALWRSGQPWFVCLGVLLLLTLAACLFASVQAVRMHSRILAYFYTLLKPKDFIEGYTLLLKQARVRPHIRFSMLINLASACTAAGDYAQAGEVLDQAETLPVAKRRKSQAILAGKRCHLYCSMGKREAAQEEWEKLEVLSRDGKLVEPDVLEQYRVRIALLDGSVTAQDADFVRGTMKQARSELFRTDMKFLLGRIYACLGETAFARAHLAEVAACDRQLTISAQAEALLKEL